MLFFSVCQRLAAYLSQNPPQLWSCSPQVWPSSWWWSQVVLGQRPGCRLPAVPLPPERLRSRRGTAQCRPGPGPPGHRRQCRRKPAFPRPVRAGNLPGRCGRCQNGHHLGMGHLAVLHLCHQKLTAVAKVSEYLTVLYVAAIFIVLYRSFFCSSVPVAGLLVSSYSFVPAVSIRPCQK